MQQQRYALPAATWQSRAMLTGASSMRDLPAAERYVAVMMSCSQLSCYLTPGLSLRHFSVTSQAEYRWHFTIYTAVLVEPSALLEARRTELDV